MAESPKRPLRVFLCHTSADKSAAHALYNRLVANGIDAWLDEEKLMPGQYWRDEISTAVRAADVIIVCLSRNSINKEGFVQKEIRFALDYADEKPEGTIYLIPAKLEECEVPPRLQNWQWVNLYFEREKFNEIGYKRLLSSLQSRARKLGALSPDNIDENNPDKEEKRTELKDGIRVRPAPLLNSRIISMIIGGGLLILLAFWGASQLANLNRTSIPNLSATSTQAQDFMTAKAALTTAVEISASGIGKLLDENIEITNKSGGPLVLTNWSIQVNGLDVFRFPDMVLRPSQIIFVHTSAGIDSTTSLHLNLQQPFLKSGYLISLHDITDEQRAEYQIP